jgi:hypothetical protein
VDAQLVAAPHVRRHRRHGLEQASGNQDVLGQPVRAVYGLCHVGDRASTPAANLVAEEAEAAQHSAAHRPLRNDASRRRVTGRDRRHLDHVPPFRHVDLEPGVVEVERAAPLNHRLEPFVDTPVDPHGVTARTER